jgi:hypothetical protein
MQAAVTRYGNWIFERVGGLCRLRGAQDLVFAASASSAGSGIAGVDVLGVPDASMPGNMLGQFMRLRFRSDGLFRAEPGAHLALGVAGAWRKPDPTLASGSGMVTGRGAIIGNVALAPSGCSESPVVQVESFRSDGNALLAGTCSPRLDDETWYALALSASNDGRIAYHLADAAGSTLASIDVLDTSGDVPRGRGGWWILHAFSDNHLERDWTFEIRDLEVGWL